MFKVGDKVLVGDLDDPAKLKEYTISSVGKDTVTCGSPELVFYTAFVWPARVKDELVRIINERRKLKKAYDDSMGMIYELRNKIARSEV